MEINQQAWAILMEDEKMALNLQYGYDKSTWEAGELMNKAHYKYLEITYRAKFLLKLFTTHFELYDHIIPTQIKIADEMAEYFTIAITKRLPVKVIYAQLNTKFGFTSNKLRDKEIEAWMINQQAKDGIILHNFLALIKEFDRWNNFRILPKNIQEPSAYKRRNKNLHRKHIKAMSKLDALSLDIIHKNLSCKTPNGFYAVILPPDQPPKVFNVRKNLLIKTGELGIYIWPSKELALEYGELVAKYIAPIKKHCKDGLNFWPNYRDIILRSSNYMEIQKLTFTRKYLEMAAAKLEYYNHQH